jgi:hypothetical protein
MRPGGAAYDFTPIGPPIVNQKYYFSKREEDERRLVYV